eukprot:gene5813-5734_t
MPRKTPNKGPGKKASTKLPPIAGQAAGSPPRDENDNEALEGAEHADRKPFLDAKKPAKKSARRDPVPAKLPKPPKAAAPGPLDAGSPPRGNMVAVVTIVLAMAAAHFPLLQSTGFTSTSYSIGEMAKGFLSAAAQYDQADYQYDQGRISWQAMWSNVKLASFSICGDDQFETTVQGFLLLSVALIAFMCTGLSHLVLCCGRWGRLRGFYLYVWKLAIIAGA